VWIELSTNETTLPVIEILGLVIDGQEVKETRTNVPRTEILMEEWQIAQEILVPTAGQDMNMEGKSNVVVEDLTTTTAVLVQEM
jgi:hypothetical protein